MRHHHISRRSPPPMYYRHSSPSPRRDRGSPPHHLRRSYHSRSPSPGRRARNSPPMPRGYTTTSPRERSPRRFQSPPSPHHNMQMYRYPEPPSEYKYFFNPYIANTPHFPPPPALPPALPFIK